MADLLECLLQIKGLRETPDRVAALVSRMDADSRDAARPTGTPGAGELLARFADLELLHGAWLRLMVASEGPALPPADAQTVSGLARFRDWLPAEALDRFVRRREDNLELLGRCSAEDLARTGVHPSRRVLTVADVVATMLASDFDRVGEMRRALGL